MNRAGLRTKRPALVRTGLFKASSFCSEGETLTPSESESKTSEKETEVSGDTDASVLALSEAKASTVEGGRRTGGSQIATWRT